MAINVQLTIFASHQLFNSNARNQSSGLNKKSTKSDCIASKNAFI
jgi:hypothetical protein